MSLSPKFRQYLSLLVLLGLLLSGCGESRLPAETAETPAPSRTAAPAPSAAPEATAEPERACLRISELMVKNRAVLRDADGDFSDWIEIENYGETPVELTGFRLTEKEGRRDSPSSGSSPRATGASAGPPARTAPRRGTRTSPCPRGSACCLSTPSAGCSPPPRA